MNIFQSKVPYPPETKSKELPQHGIKTFPLVVVDSKSKMQENKNETTLKYSTECLKTLKVSSKAYRTEVIDKTI